ncbi:hypothetical protein MKW92_039527 [Papaver armeniacum]|nr:hypothetical protein MKW92_039527 [Papaver armeniacum]
MRQVQLQQIRADEFTTVPLEDRAEDETQPILPSLDRSVRRRCRCTTKTSLFYVSGGLVFFLLLIFIVSTTKWHRAKTPPTIVPDNYSAALKKALLFFDAQMSGPLQASHRIPWRGNSGLNDGARIPGRLTGGFYDSGSHVKVTFTMAHSMTLLSWSVLEYRHKYIIRWGADYLLRTYHTSAAGHITKLYTQVGTMVPGSTRNDLCWERPEDMDYERVIFQLQSAPDVAAEMAASLAAASMVFQDDKKYSQQLVAATSLLIDFAMHHSEKTTPTISGLDVGLLYRSSSYHDEIIWASAWIYFATGDTSYLSMATDETIARKAGAFKAIENLRIPSWDNKLPGVSLLLKREREFMSPGYPYEEMLMKFDDMSGDNACSYLRKFAVFNYTRGGLIQLNDGGPKPLQYVVSAVYIAKVFADYLLAQNLHGWICGSSFIHVDELKDFATSQMQYILGANPSNTSFIVGYGARFPTHVHHRAASIPMDGHKYNCTSGKAWLHTSRPNPYNITGAMVGGPDSQDGFHDERGLPNYTEPTLVGNAALVAALASMTISGGSEIDANSMFSNVPKGGPEDPAPPAPWKPTV